MTIDSCDVEWEVNRTMEMLIRIRGLSKPFWKHAGTIAFYALMLAVLVVLSFWSSDWSLTKLLQSYNPSNYPVASLKDIVVALSAVALTIVAFYILHRFGLIKWDKAIGAASILPIASLLIVAPALSYRGMTPGDSWAVVDGLIEAASAVGDIASMVVGFIIMWVVWCGIWTSPSWLWVRVKRLQMYWRWGLHANRKRDELCAMYWRAH